MEVKKSPKANMERNRGIFLMVGLVVALGLIWLLFELPQKQDKVKEVQYAMDKSLEENVVITKHDVTPPPPPPKPKVKVTDVIEVTEKTLDVKEDIKVDADVNEDDKVAIKKIEPDEEDNNADEPDIFLRAQKMPEFPGGVKALLKYLSKHLKYPQVAVENGIQGKVYLKFVVEKNGSVGEVQVLRSPDKLLEKEAVRVVKTLPKFQPGKQRNKPVRVWYQVPVTFKLQ